MGTDFINRKYDFIELKDWANSIPEMNKGIFIYAKSGIGKSTLVSELFSREFSSYKKIKVEMLSADAATSFSFLKTLYRKVIKETEKNGVLPLSKRMTLDNTISISQIIGINVSWSEKNGYENDIVQMMSYLHNKLNGDLSYIIDFENFHLIDNESFECLQQLFQIGNGHRFIFEFTTETLELSTRFYHLFEQISKYLNCQIYELKKLQFKDVYTLCEKKQLPLKFAKELYEENEGNLFPIIMLQYTDNHNSHYPLREIINELQEDQQLILFLIELSQGLNTVEIIQDIFATGSFLLAGNIKYNKSYIQTQCNVLANKGLIVKIDNEIKLRQDQLLEVISRCRKTPLYYLAGNLFENYHYTKLKNSNKNERESHVLALLHIYSILTDIKIMSILPELTRIILRQRPHGIIKKIKMIKDKLDVNDANRHLIEDLSRYLADICIAVGQWKAALEQIEGFYSEYIPWQACYLAAVLAANPNVPNAENRILRMRDRYKKNNTINMSISVSLLSFYMRTAPELVVNKIGKQLLDEFRGQNGLNYAFLLKNHSNTLQNQEALVALNACNQIFKNYHRTDLIAMTNITIASRLVYSGYPEKGLALLNKTESKILKLDIPVRRHYFYCNRAAMHLLLGNYDNNTEQELNAAYVLSSVTFEKAIILCNLMIFYLLSNRKANAEKIFQRLHTLDVSQYVNIDLELILKQNYLYYYESMGMKTKAAEAEVAFLEIAFAKECPPDIKFYILSYFPEKYPSIKERTFMSNYKYRPDFIGYWQYEVCCDSSNTSHLTTLSKYPDIMNFES